MVKIRLSLGGDKKTPIYRVVVVDSRSPRNSAVIEQIGNYFPKEEQGQTKIDIDKAKKWLACGAQPSDTVKTLLINAGAMPAPAKRAPAKTPKKKGEAAKA